MLTEMFNIVGFNITKKLSGKQKKSLSQIYSTPPDQVEWDERLYDHCTSTDHSLEEASMSPDTLRVLIRAEEELAQTHGFERLVPSVEFSKYLKYLENDSHTDQLLAEWEEQYHAKRGEAREMLSRLCRNNLHLQTVE